MKASIFWRGFKIYLISILIFEITIPAYAVRATGISFTSAKSPTLQASVMSGIFRREDHAKRSLRKPSTSI